MCAELRAQSRVPDERFVRTAAWGLYGQQLGSWAVEVPQADTYQKHHVLADRFETIAEVLQKAGYVTATMGKWHLGKDPTTQGFDVNIAGREWGSPSGGGYHSPHRYPNLVNPKRASISPIGWARRQQVYRGQSGQAVLPVSHALHRAHAHPGEGGVDGEV